MIQRGEWECYYYTQRDGTFLYGVIRREPLKILTRVFTTKDDAHHDALIRELEGRSVTESVTNRGYL